MFTVRVKLVLAYTLVFGLLLSGFALMVYHKIKKSEMEKIDAALMAYSAQIKAEVEEQINEEGRINIDELKIEPHDRVHDPKIALFNKKGMQIFSELPELTQPGIFVPKILKDGHKYSKTSVKDTKYRMLLTGIEVNDDYGYVIAVAGSLNDMEDDMEEFRLLFIILIPMGLILAGIAAYFISTVSFKPIKNMSKTARRISGSNLSERLAVPKPRDEIRSLAKTLNEMIDRIESSFKSQNQFVADASHELKTPLTIIKTELELTKSKITDENFKESLEISLAEIDHLNDLTGSLLTLTRLDSELNRLVPVNFRLDELIVESVQSLKNAASIKKINFSVTIDEFVEINADLEKIRSIIVNLLGNAIKYSHPGGNVKISLTKENSLAMIKIKDEGIGISTADAPKIFERFFRASEVRSAVPGSGLGLAIVKKSAEMHGGSISFKSVHGEGSEFMVILPLYQNNSKINFQFLKI